MSNENEAPTGVGALAFATQLPGCGGGASAGARSPPSTLPLSQVDALADAELLTTQPQVEVVDSRLEGHGRRAETWYCVSFLVDGETQWHSEADLEANLTGWAGLLAAFNARARVGSPPRPPAAAPAAPARPPPAGPPPGLAPDFFAAPSLEVRDQLLRDTYPAVWNAQEARAGGRGGGGRRGGGAGGACSGQPADAGAPQPAIFRRRAGPGMEVRGGNGPSPGPVEDGEEEEGAGEAAAAPAPAADAPLVVVEEEAAAPAPALPAAAPTWNTREDRVAARAAAEAARAAQAAVAAAAQADAVDASRAREQGAFTEAELARAARARVAAAKAAGTWKPLTRSAREHTPLTYAFTQEAPEDEVAVVAMVEEGEGEGEEVGVCGGGTTTGAAAATLATLAAPAPGSPVIEAEVIHHGPPPRHLAAPPGGGPPEPAINGLPVSLFAPPAPPPPAGGGAEGLEPSTTPAAAAGAGGKRPAATATPGEEGEEGRQPSSGGASAPLPSRTLTRRELAARLSVQGWAGAVIRKMWAAAAPAPGGGSGGGGPGPEGPTAAVLWPDGVGATVRTAVLKEAGMHTAATLLAYYETRLVPKAVAVAAKGRGKGKEKRKRGR